MRHLIAAAVAVAACAPPEPVRYSLPGWDTYCDLGTSDDGRCRSPVRDMAPLGDGALAMFHIDGRLEVVEPTDQGLRSRFSARAGSGRESATLVPCDVDGDGSDDIVVGSRATVPYVFVSTGQAEPMYEGQLWNGALSELGCADFDDDGRGDVSGVYVEQDNSDGTTTEGPFLVIWGTEDGLVDVASAFGVPIDDHTVAASHRVETCGATMVASTGLLSTEVAVTEYLPETGFSALNRLPLAGTAQRARFLELDDALLLLVLVRVSEDEHVLEVFRRPACSGVAFSAVGQVPIGRVLDWSVDHDAGQVLLVDADAPTIHVLEWADPDGFVTLDELSATAISATFFDDGSARGVLWASVLDPYLTFVPLD